MADQKKKKTIQTNVVSAHKEGEVCPAFLTLGLIANKWSIRILHVLMGAQSIPQRFRVIQKALPGLTQRELTKHLRAFEQAGLVTRRVYAEVPPRVEYVLTPLGYSLHKPVEALSEWAEEHGAQIQENRTRFLRGAGI